MNMRRRTLNFDLMRVSGRDDERFVATMSYPQSTLLKPDLGELYKWIMEQRPTLKNEVVRLHFDDVAVKAITFYPKGKKAKI